MRIKHIRILDYLIFGFILCIALWTGVFLYGKNTHKKTLIIESPKGKWRYSLMKPQTVKIPGAIGITEICIKNNTVWIVSSPCPNRTCMAASYLAEGGDWNACLPNRVFIRIEGGADDDL